ncbi:uncharacterized protein LOC125189443 [Salvia hispanica]|uniref:uncharacterized protein LOC125189443 n=1 Tax=Salvia hispanica TaxID=49212 RepID=UPI00200985AB|nr:uncharacterized protein LOC125189443 [Salvia hispanica]
MDLEVSKNVGSGEGITTPRCNSRRFVPWKVETDDSGAISPPLWRNRSSSPSLPLLSPDSRAQAIARGRSELMEMVRHMPESSYELSLKDIVEHHHRAENQIEGGSDRGGAATGLKKEESRKIERNKTVVVGGGGGSGRVSPKLEGWKGGGERDWWKKKFTGSSSRTSNTSGGGSTGSGGGGEGRWKRGDRLRRRRRGD